MVPVDQGHLKCHLCGKMYGADAGRLHEGSFACKTCANVQQTIRRNLGSAASLQEWTKEETHKFFQKVQETKDSRDDKLLWATVKAVLLKSLTERQISKFQGRRGATALVGVPHERLAPRNRRTVSS